MFNHIKIISLAFLLALSSTVAAAQAASSKTKLPKRIQADYEVTKQGEPFATVSEQFVVTDKAYKIESVTKGIGIYALAGERQLTSIGEVTAQGLKPSRFELRQSSNPRKSLFADFDWAKQNLRMTVKGKLKEANLTPATQDLASYAYQFMYLPRPLKDTITVSLTTGKKLNQYQYKIKPEIETVNTGDRKYKTLHLVPAEQDKQETKELWLAVEHHYVPVRIMMIEDDGQKIEQTLTGLRVE